MPNHKKIRVFAGPNGSGKSTLFQEFSKNYSTGPFINADEIERQLEQYGLIDLTELGITADQVDLNAFSKQPSSVSLLEKAKNENVSIDITVRENFIVDRSRISHSYEGAFTASFLRYLLQKNQKSFSFESVFSHPSKIKELISLRDNGFLIYLYFICIDSPQVNIDRVDNRIDKGGHKVSSEKIENRYYRTLELLHQILPLCFRAYLFDNSGKNIELIAEAHNNIMELKTNQLPNWFKKYVLPHYTP